MRVVVKNFEPESFLKWKATGNADWQPSYGNLRNPVKAQLHRSLLNEQYWTCCYCGRSIDLSSSHIEHFRPQRDPYEANALEYVNLFASCLRKLEPRSPLHCGPLKADEFSESYLSPLDPLCEKQFRYTLDGQILGSTNVALEMVRVLGLGISFLQSRRSAAIQSVFDDSFLDEADTESLLKIAAAFREPDEEGKLPPFFHAVARFAETLIANR